MIVTFVSQCEKKSLKRTRRILDSFANRIGDNVWQTAITEDGLQTVKQLLRKSATKSTAVSCHRNKTRQLTELVWVVGNKRQFNEVGVVPVNWTKRNLLHREWENNWTSLESMQIIATIAALLHDIGKSTIGFQHKLFHQSSKGDPYRHEWISLKLFIWLIADCNTDEEWLERLRNLPDYLSSNSPTSKVWQQDVDKAKLDQLPPLAGWVAWLIVTHHRLPPLTAYWFNESTAEKLKKANNPKLKAEQQKFYTFITPYDYWVRNPKSIADMNTAEQESFWQFDDLVIYSSLWQRKLKRWVKKATLHPQLQQLSQQATEQKQVISDPFLLHLSRLCLMIGDHNYSSLDANDKRRVQGSVDFKDKLAANTDRQTHKIKQALDEHLIGVGDFTAQFCRSLPAIHNGLPRLIGHDPLVKNTAHKRFKWQNKAFKQAYEHRVQSEEHGFFGVNMTSTGGGKTIGNARIMYALADPRKGARITVALGLRVLTLQTGLSFREDLQLNASQLAVLVGGTAQKQLFELTQMDSNPNTTNTADLLTDYQESFESANYDSVLGSESANPLIDEWIESEIDIADYEELGLGTVIESKKTQELLFAPMVVCTIDHIIQASECKRGGKHIAPILRLLSSDLILDEPDDFDHKDLPALSRLVHLAGLFGSRVILSSATLPPDMVQGLFASYLAGRQLFNAQLQKSNPNVICGWFDENNSVITPCINTDNFKERHSEFVAARIDYLEQQPIRRQANILPIALTYEKEQHIVFYEKFATALLNQASVLHLNHSIKKKDNPYQVSIGLIRMANIQPLMNTAMAMFNLDDTPAAQTTHYHLCCYHANQVLILRNRLETKLDKLLKRGSANEHDIFNSEHISNAIKTHGDKTHHIFIVLATAVAEVGRDHDYDWAIVEPSSMRSIIQLAGRVWRHRPDKIANTSNISLLQYNIRALKQSNRGGAKPVFTMPGFEQKDFLLASHNSEDIFREAELQRIDARSRIHNAIDTHSDFNGSQYLSDLEQSVMKDLMANDKTNVVNGYWQVPNTSNRSHVHLSCLTPFRAGQAQTEYIIEPTDFKSLLNNDQPPLDINELSDEFNESLHQYLVYDSEQARTQGLSKTPATTKVIKPNLMPLSNEHVTPWLHDSLINTLLEVQSAHADLSPNTILMRFAVVSVYDNKLGWFFDERFGCWKDEGLLKDGYR